MPYTTSGKSKAGRLLQTVSRLVMSGIGTGIVLTVIFIIGAATLRRGAPGDRAIGLTVCAVPVLGVFGIVGSRCFAAVKRRRRRRAAERQSKTDEHAPE